MNRWHTLEGTPSPFGATWVESERAYNFASYLTAGDEFMSSDRIFRKTARSVRCPATGWAAAGTVHRIECGGEDGELHTGAFNPNIIANNDEVPVLSPRQENDPGWGIVSEFPNARRGDGPTLFRQANRKYYRHWPSAAVE
jgi:hypothetical protein